MRGRQDQHRVEQQADSPVLHAILPRVVAEEERRRAHSEERHVGLGFLPG